MALVVAPEHRAPPGLAVVAAKPAVREDRQVARAATAVLPEKTVVRVACVTRASA